VILILIITAIKLALMNSVATLDVNVICLITKGLYGVKILYFNTDYITGY
jgi:hypothetical protein